MDEIGIGSEIYLEPEEEKIKNAAEIAAVSESMEKFIFTVFYALSDKEVILSELKRIGAGIVNHTDKDSAVTVKMSMQQLAAIKTLECVERVEMPEQNKAKTISEKVSTEATSIVIPKASEENGISLLCYGDSSSSGSDCDCSNDISTAIYLPLSTWKSGSIHCPYAETWYRFTASVSNASQYRIYTTGSLDTMGYLYDANGSYITQNDDNGGLNFSITRSLTYGATYYICVRAYGSNTGNFSLRVDYTTSSSSGNDNSDDGSNDMSTAITLPLSTYVSGSIECPCAEKWYRFTASNSNASQYTIYTSGSLDTVGYLYNSNGTLITSNDDSGANMNFSITRTLTYGATYYLKVKAYGSSTGSYNVRVDYETSSAEPDDNDCSNEMASAINLNLNSWQSGEIGYPGTEMWYKFTPSATAYYTIYTVGSLDTYGYLYNSNGTEIDHDDDDGSGLNFRMAQRLTANQTYYIKAKAFGNNTGFFSIAVTNTVFVESVSINQSYVYLDKGETANLTATVAPSYATNKTLRWGTGNASVATVSQSGVVTAQGAGTTCVFAYSQDGSEKSSCCEVAVNVPVESVTINTSSLLMRVGEYDDLDAEICPTDAVNKLIRWTSTNTAVVWVNEATGRVEARGVGSATIYATAQDGTGVKGSCAVQVEPPIPVQGIDICCDNYTMNVGETAYLSYDIYPADATNKNVTWCSSNTSVAEVNASTGRITAKLAGTTTITVTTNDGSFVDNCNVSVNQILTYPDTLITHNETRQKIIKLKTLMDENQKAYLEGKISVCTKDLIEQQLSTECDVARADYIVVGNNPTSNYAYAILGGNASATVPFSFANNLTLNSTGLAVIVVQRALEIMGYYEPKDSENYGVFDTNTYDSACSYPALMSYDNQIQKYVFDNASFNVLFQTSTQEERTFNAFTELNKFKTVHNIVAQWSAEKVGGTYKMADNIINNGNSAGNYYGYADVLKDTGVGTYIWEVKPDKERYYRVGGIGDRQLQRYLYAGNTYEQEFTKPLTIGYNIGNFTIPFLFNKYINVRNFNNPVVATDARNGLILYKVEDTSEFSIETVPVIVEEPSESYDYDYSYSFDTSTWGPVIVVGTAVVLGIVCIVLAGPSGGTSLVPLTLLAA